MRQSFDCFELDGIIFNFSSNQGLHVNNGREDEAFVDGYGEYGEVELSLYFDMEKKM